MRFGTEIGPEKTYLSSWTAGRVRKTLHQKDHRPSYAIKLGHGQTTTVSEMRLPMGGEGANDHRLHNNSVYRIILSDNGG